MCATPQKVNSDADAHPTRDASNDNKNEKGVFLFKGALSRIGLMLPHNPGVPGFEARSFDVADGRV